MFRWNEAKNIIEFHGKFQKFKFHYVQMKHGRRYKESTKRNWFKFHYVQMEHGKLKKGNEDK